MKTSRLSDLKKKRLKRFCVIALIIGVCAFAAQFLPYYIVIYGFSLSPLSTVEVRDVAYHDFVKSVPAVLAVLFAGLLSLRDDANE